MSNIILTAPVKKPEDIEDFIPHVKCRSFYVYHHKFLENNFEYVNKFIETAHKNNCKIYVNFKHNITESDLIEIKNSLHFLNKQKYDGILIKQFCYFRSYQNSFFTI